MSLHASLSPEAQAELDSQKKTSTIFSVIIALLAMGLLSLVLYVISLAIEQKNTPEIISYGNPLAPTEKEVEEVVENEVTTKPTASASVAKVLTAVSNSPTSVPTLTVDAPELSFELGEEMDFSDWDTGTASAAAAVSGFGSPTRIAGTLGGYFYDFKQKRNGDEVKRYFNDTQGNFVKRVKKLHRGRFSSSSLSDHFKGEKQLFLRYVAIPFGPATAGPRYFGVEKQVKPSGWIAHYKGTVSAPKDGTFRFVGLGDDYLAVGVNGKPHLLAPWWTLRNDLKIESVNTDSDIRNEGPFGVNKAERLRNCLLTGRWFKVKKGETFEVDIAFGECPGGKMGYVLMIEEKGVTYKKQASGSPILPPFTVGKLHEDDIKKLSEYPGWKFKLDDVPVFNSQD